ncbi:MAG: hypothetical protein AB8I69_07550 [Anaerolineae bacterium]
MILLSWVAGQVATLEEVAATVHGHPTLGEAALAACGVALHLPQ